MGTHVHIVNVTCTSISTRMCQCFELGPIIAVLPPPEDVDTPPIDISLHLPLLCFSPSTVLQIVTCLLTERRLVFVSRDWPLLTLMTECFVYYLRPLPWRHPYIPVLASSMLDMLMAPTVFLMGCHSRHIRTVIELEELVLVDIDQGTVWSFPRTRSSTPPLCPPAITEEFITSVRRLRLHPELASASLPICTGLAAVRQRGGGGGGGVGVGCGGGGGCGGGWGCGGGGVGGWGGGGGGGCGGGGGGCGHLRTDLFHCFLKARLNDRVDAFSRWELATHPQTPRIPADWPGVRIHPIVVPRCLYLPPLPSAPLDDLSVSLFYTKLVVDITRELEGVGGDDGGVRAACLYLRGVVRLCQGQPVPALLDFQSLEKIDMDFFPLELVRQTLESMNTEQLRALQETEGLKGLLHGVLEKHWDRARPEHSVRDLELPVWPLDRQQFTALAQAAGLVSTTITADCLFDILAAGQDRVPARMFTRMYRQWRVCGEEGVVGCPSEVLASLREGEILSLVSLPVKTNLGTGRLLLTNHRLSLLTDSTAPCREIAQLRDVEEVEAAVPVSGLPLRGGSLKVGVRGQKHAFVATLRGERDLWKLALREVCAGKLLAHRHKDPQYNQQARSNVRLLQAVALCPPPSRTAHLMCRLAQLDQAASQPLPVVPQMTSDALKHMLHLSDAASISLTDTALLYVPGKCPHRHSTAQHGTARHSTARYSTAQHGTARYSTVQHSTVRHGTAQHSTARYSTVQHGTARYSTAQYSPVQHGTARYSTVQHGTARHGTAQHSTAQHSTGSLDPGERVDSPPTLWCTLADGRLLVYNAATWKWSGPPIRAGTACLDSYIYVVSGNDRSCHRRLTAHRNQVTGLVQGTPGQDRHVTGM
ncbi:DENN domain-containing protein 3-like [Leucoraja erinacea]|uniref:DENN domain-containing protein 3-like n=1 Tax=Leucoraja erinaceus TaxID=7782 RepID=UPI002456F523|nr:DENN domain-containing protein 3-like [Leucoraja erinacea]